MSDESSARPVSCVSNQRVQQPPLVESSLAANKKETREKKFQGKGDASTGGVALRYKLTPTKWLAQKFKDTNQVHSSRTRPATGTEVSTRSREHSGLPVPCAWGGRPGDGRVICRKMQVAGLGKLVCTGGSCQGWVSGRLIVLCCSVLCCAVGRSRTDRRTIQDVSCWLRHYCLPVSQPVCQSSNNGSVARQNDRHLPVINERSSRRQTCHIWKSSSTVIDTASTIPGSALPRQGLVFRHIMNNSLEERPSPPAGEHGKTSGATSVIYDRQRSMSTDYLHISTTRHLVQVAKIFPSNGRSNARR